MCAAVEEKEGACAQYCVPLAYSDIDGQPPTFVRVYRHFGPTYPGSFDEQRLVYRLSYPGVVFEFSVPEERADLFRKVSCVCVCVSMCVYFVRKARD